LKDFADWLRQTTEDEKIPEFDPGILEEFWKRMALGIHENPELNGSKSEVSNCILGWVYYGGLANFLFRRDAKKIKTAACFISRTLLNPFDCQNICVVARSEITKTLGLDRISISEDSPLGIEVDQLALMQVSAIQNWLHDLFGLSRKRISLEHDGTETHKLKQFSFCKLPHILEENRELFTDLYKTDLSQIETALDRLTEKWEGITYEYQ
jgi:hypothetical protein